MIILLECLLYTKLYTKYNMYILSNFYLQHCKTVLFLYNRKMSFSVMQVLDQILFLMSMWVTVQCSAYLIAKTPLYPAGTRREPRLDSWGLCKYHFNLSLWAHTTSSFPPHQNSLSYTLIKTLAI